MKKTIYLVLAALSFLSVLSSCREDKLEKDSVIKVDQRTSNDFDKWLEANYVDPYNIEVMYRYTADEASSYSYYTVPADLECSIIMAHVVKYLCIDAYDEVAGIKFTRTYFPKMFFYIGEWEYNNAGSFRLGTAEGGRKIYLTGVNYLKSVLDGSYATNGYTGSTNVDWSDIGNGLNHFYIKTIHHEFTHILNQTKDIPTDFREVTASSYVADAWNEKPYSVEYLDRGFISNYAQKDVREDFAEMMSIYITNSEAKWNARIDSASDEAKAYIAAKLDIVKKYMVTNYNIDLDEMRAAVLRRQDEVIRGDVDLTSLIIN